MRRILVIDDDALVRSYLGRLLKSFGYLPLGTASASEGLRLAQEVPPDLIILDWVLKGSSGPDLIKVLKSHRDTAQIPVVLISGLKESAEDQARAKRSGAALFFAKDEIRRDTSGFHRRLQALLAEPPRRQSVLVVEDDEGLQGLSRFILERNGFEPIMAGTGREGLHKARSETPAAILLDMSLPDLNGVEVYRQLLEDDRTKSIPVLAMTALDNTSQVLSSALTTLGVRRFLRKPFGENDMLQALHDTLRSAPPAPSSGGVPPDSAKFLVAGPFRLDLRQHKVWVDGRLVLQNAARQVELLHALLISRDGLSREALLARVWGDSEDIKVVDVTVSRLRKALGRHGHKITSIPGGYRLIEAFPT